ncbi:hypothetical protein B0O99DRAFT_727840 [Bisporella sp. PMI_857]|nr:hypothetical protein B0O99DRAFT_727840 [Bisporella sp. PMI_857]
MFIRMRIQNFPNRLGLPYADRGKLAEAKAMYTRALQGYENALGPEILHSHLPALDTMFVFGDLFSRTGRKDMAKEMYSRALSGYTIIQGPSSKWCRELEDRLQALQAAPIESEGVRLKRPQLEPWHPQHTKNQGMPLLFLPTQKLSENGMLQFCETVQYNT